MDFAEITLQLAAFRLFALLILAGVQGAAIAGAAVLLGDRGPKYDGRLSAMPTAHTDAVGLVAAILFGVGWGKPVEVDAAEMRAGRAGLVLAALAGIASLLVAAVILDALTVLALTGLPHTAGLSVAAFLRGAASLAIGMALLNLLPIPPLTGGLILGALGVRVPRQAIWVGSAILVAALATGVVERALAPAQAVLAAALLGR